MPTPVQLAADLVASGQYARAEGVLRSYLARKRDDAAASYLLGHALVRQGRVQQAVYFLERAVAGPTVPTNAIVEYGCVLFDSGKKQAGVDQLFRATAQDPKSAHAWTVLGKMLLQGGLFVDGMEAALRAMTADPDAPEAMSIYASCLLGLGRCEQAVEWYGRAVAHAPDNAAFRANLCFAMNSHAGLEPSEVFRAHVELGRVLASQAGPVSPIEPDRAPGRKIRVGLLSPDLREHPVARFMLPILRDADRSRFEFVGFSSYTMGDAVTARVKGFTTSWHEVEAVGDADLAALIRRERIDILLDLGGHTGNSRVGVMARRTAPVQITYLGYPNTTGVPNVDFRIVDAITDPPGTEAFASERLLRLPGCFLCFEPEPASPTPAAANEGPIRFGCFNNPTKMTSPTLSLWRRVLDSVAGSRLVLKGKGMADAKCRVAFERRFTEAGLDLSRIDLLPYAKTTTEHLASYGRVDIALDTYPYHGTTTTCEALWMGVPVVTLAGRVHAARVGASLLTAAGCAEWIADTEQRYIEIAAGLASGRAALTSLRGALRGRLEASTLRNAHAFVRGFEAALEQAWSITTEGHGEPRRGIGNG